MVGKRKKKRGKGEENLSQGQRQPPASKSRGSGAYVVGRSGDIYEQAVVKTVVGFFAGSPNIYSALPIRGATSLRMRRLPSA